MFVLFIWRLSASKQIQYLLFFSIILYSAIAVCYVCETSVKHWLWINYLLLLRYFLQYVCSFSSKKWCFVLISVWSSFLFPYFVLCLFLSRGCIQQHSLNSSIIYFYIVFQKNALQRTLYARNDSEFSLLLLRISRFSSSRSLFHNLVFSHLVDKNFVIFYYCLNILI